MATHSHHPEHHSSLPASGAGSPAPRALDPSTVKSKRKQTLLSLLDALNELSQDNSTEEFETNETPNFNDDRDVPTVDEHLQVAGAETFNKFQKRVNNLDNELRNFANASRQLGSSVGILSSAFQLRERLAQILFLFRENAAGLFPRKVQRKSKETSIINPAFTAHYKRKQTKPPAPRHASGLKPQVDDNLDPENFPDQIEQFAVDVTTFLNCLNEFPEFTDEAVNASILSFEGDLKYWASCLRVYKSQFRFPAVQRYIHDLTSEMGDHLDTITSTLSMFIEIGVPTIRFAQQHGAANLLNLSTVATFFSAVTATTLQFSFNIVGYPLADAVNGFWFSSLVFSIAAAVNSLLGLTWKQAMYRSPGHRVPWWVLIWIKRSPLVFLVFSVACFSVGLVLFAYSSGQNRVTCTVTTVLTAFTSFGLAAVSTWFASERWTYNHHQGRKWLSDVLDDANKRFLQLRAMVATRRAMVWSGTRIKQAGNSLRRVPSFYAGSHIDSDAEKAEDHDNSTGGLPFTHNPNNSGPMSPIGRQRPDFPSYPTFDARTPVTSPVSSDGHSEFSGNSVDAASTTSPARSRFTHAVRSVMMIQNMSGGLASAFTSNRQRTTLRDPAGAAADVTKKELELDMARGSRVSVLVPKLKQLESVYDLMGHQALVKHLQFSPDGKLLATSSWDRTSLIFRVGEPEAHRVLAHPQGFVGQVAWSPDGKYLLTKLNRGVKIWTDDGVCKRTIDRHRAVQSVTWFPGGEAFLSVEGTLVIKLDLTGKVLDTYSFQPVVLHDVAVTPDGHRLIGVGPLLSSPTGLSPSKSRVEKRLVVYNMDTQQTEGQTPVMNDVRDVTVAKSGLFALVSYENKAPPQLWRVEMVKDRNDNTKEVARLTLRHTFMPKIPVDFAGPSYFGGKDDQLVLCAGKAGDIHIWHRTSGAMLHHIRAQDVGGDLTCIAWNGHAEDPFMFGTGSHDGAVRIWSSLAQVDERKPARWSSPKQSPKQGDGDSGLLMRKEEKKPEPSTTPLPLVTSPTPEPGVEYLYSDRSLTLLGQARRPQTAAQSTTVQENGLLRLPTVPITPHASLQPPSKGRLSPLQSTLPNITITTYDDSEDIDSVQKRAIAFAPTP